MCDFMDTSTLLYFMDQYVFFFWTFPLPFLLDPNPIPTMKSKENSNKQKNWSKLGKEKKKRGKANLMQVCVKLQRTMFIDYQKELQGLT